MNNQQKERELSWFIKDEAISDLKQDEFAHIDLARELKQKIEWLGPPLTISLESQHGTGKSVVGELLRAQFQSDSRYQFVRIEAWRHSGDSRRKAFLFDVIEELKTAFHDRKNDKAVASLCKLQEGLYQASSEQHAVLSFRGLRATWMALKAEARRPAVLRFIGCVIAAIVVLGVWVVLTANTGIKAALLSMILAIPGIFSLAGVVYFGTVLSKMAESILEPAKITFTTSPPTSSEQFEQIFRDLLRVIGAASTESGSKSEKTLVILVDELDRLPVDEIIQAINVVRTFRDVNPCVVVVALDTEVVVRALQQKPTESAGLIRNDSEAEEFLNKFFKFRLHLPPLVPSDMQAFARTLIESGRLTGGIGSLKGTALDDVLDGLIHPGVTTPRHVIRLLNEFNSDLRLALRRESPASSAGSNGKLLSQGTVTGNMPFLAMVTAMREDFSLFHADMARNQELVQVIEDGLSGKLDGADGADLDENYPGYREICLRYFDVVPIANQDKADGADTAGSANSNEAVDWSKPLPAYRDLVLHLQANRRFRATVVAPFIFFREDASARALGSGEQALGMATEFWSNATVLLRGRFERAKEANQAGFSGGAATVALHCLADGRGSQRRNAALAVCAMIDQFDPSRAGELSDAVSRTADDIRTIIDAVGSELPAEQFLRTLSERPHGFHQERCLSAVTDRIERLSAQLETDDAEDEVVTVADNILHAVSLHPDLFMTDERRAAITALASAVSKRITVEEAKGWLDTLCSSTLPFSREELFGPKAWQNLVAKLRDTESATIPNGSADSLRNAVITIEQKAMETWPREYIQLFIGLQGATRWEMRDIGFDVLERQRERLNLNEASTGLRAVVKSSTEEGFEERSEARTLYPRIAAWIEMLCKQDIGGELLHEKTTEEEMDAHCAKFVVLDDDDLRHTGYSVFEAVAPKSEIKYAKTSAALIAYIVNKLPAATAREAFETLIKVPAETSVDEFSALYTTLILPLRSLQVSDQSMFAADALLLALELGDGNNARAVALTQTETLVPLYSAGYAPSQLEQVDRVVKRAIPLLSDAARQSYVSGLNSILLRASDAPQQLFVLDHLAALRRDGTMPLTSIAVICTSLASTWTSLTTPEARVLAAQLLDAWSSSLPVINRDAHLTNMAAYAGEDPKMAWNAVRSFWSQMNTAQQVAAVKSSWQGEVQAQILEDISAESNHLDTDSISSLLIGADQAKLPQHEKALELLASALTRHSDNEEKNFLAESIFVHIANQPEPLEFRPLFLVACSLQVLVQVGGAPVIASALRGDIEQQQYGLTLLSKYLRVPNEGNLTSVLIPAVAPILAMSHGEDLRLLVDLLKAQGWATDPIVVASSQQAIESLKKNRSKEARVDRAILNSIQPRKVKKFSS